MPVVHSELSVVAHPKALWPWPQQSQLLVAFVWVSNMCGHRHIALGALKPARLGPAGASKSDGSGCCLHNKLAP